MNTTRRDFLRYCGMSAATLGLTATDSLSLLRDALANPNGPSVWRRQGAGCTGCSIPLLNRISPQAPTTAADSLIELNQPGVPPEPLVGCRRDGGSPRSTRRTRGAATSWPSKAACPPPLVAPRAG